MHDEKILRLKNVTGVISLLIAIFIIICFQTRIFYNSVDWKEAKEFTAVHAQYIEYRGKTEAFNSYLDGVDKYDYFSMVAGALGFELNLMQEDLTAMEKYDAGEEELEMTTVIGEDGKDTRKSTIQISCDLRNDFYSHNDCDSDSMWSVMDSMGYLTGMFTLHVNSANKGDVATRMITDAVRGIYTNMLGLSEQSHIVWKNSGILVTAAVVSGLVFWIIIVPYLNYKIRRESKNDHTRDK